MANHLFDIWIAHRYLLLNMYKTLLNSVSDTIYQIQVKSLADASHSHSLISTLLFNIDDSSYKCFQIQPHHFTFDASVLYFQVINMFTTLLT